MKTRLTQAEKAKIKDFQIGNVYTSRKGIKYKVLEVTPTHIVCQLNKAKVKFSKILYAGVYAALKFGSPIFLSDKITRATED